jgi:hypothetical protein
MQTLERSIDRRRAARPAVVRLGESAAVRHGEVGGVLHLWSSPEGQMAELQLDSACDALVIAYCWWRRSVGSRWVGGSRLDLAVTTSRLRVPVSTLTDRDRVGHLALELIDPTTCVSLQLSARRVFAPWRSWTTPRPDPGAGYPSLTA